MVGIFFLLNDFPNLLLGDEFWNFSNIFSTFQRRQEELERRAQELERREAELRNNPNNGN